VRQRGWRMRGRIKKKNKVNREKRERRK